MQLFKITPMLVIGLLSGCDSQQLENGNNGKDSRQPDSSVPLIVV